MAFNKLIHFFKSKIQGNSKTEQGNNNNNHAKAKNSNSNSKNAHKNKNSNHIKSKNNHVKKVANINNNHANNNNSLANNNLEPIQSSDVLLSNHTKLIADIYHHSCVDKKHFEELYLNSIKTLALWSQSLPASQNHHHSHHGGLLLHTLEVIEIAIKHRNTKMLPIGVSVEMQNDKKDLYSFAVFTCALLHDIGKLITDVEVMLYDNCQQPIGRWSPWFGAMGDVGGAKFYQYQHNRSRQYQQHRLLPLSFLRQFISLVAIDWMQQDPSLFNLLLMTLQGRHLEGGVIADIVKYADSSSSAKSLANQGSSPSAGSINNGNVGNAGNTQPQAKSLADKLLDTMRYLVLETNIKINTPGATMFTTDRDIYFVSKVMMDNVRESLNNNNQKGVPYDNSRMMDELLQFNIITPNAKGKAIWDCELSGGGFKNPVNLTMLRMPIDKIYFKVEDDKNYDEPFAGDIVIKGKQQIDNEPAGNQAINNQATNNIAKTSTKASASSSSDGLNNSHNPNSNPNNASINNPDNKNQQDNEQHSKPKDNTNTIETKTTDSELLLPMPPGFDIEPGGNQNINHSSQEILQMPKPIQAIPTSIPIIPTTSVTPTTPTPIMPTPAVATSITPAIGTDIAKVSITGSRNNKQVVLATELGQDFLKWLVLVINSRNIPINTAKSRVHIVMHNANKALFLVSPKIFKEYDIDRWARVQKQFGRLKINLKTPTDENIWQVQTITQRRSKKPSKIGGYLIVNLESHGFIKLPEPNSYLDLLVD